MSDLIFFVLTFSGLYMFICYVRRKIEKLAEDANYDFLESDLEYDYYL